PPPMAMPAAPSCQAPPTGLPLLTPPPAARTLSFARRLRSHGAATAAASPAASK
uniref:Uncharacterized protein n=1 Tax=Oryza glaberrima TaxID=4538 RepID=I1NZJ8_ORYGL